ncbi:MAG: hypothetical protein Q7J27_13535 [Syntrophales bacterium]|nr:hypothetical protein [Syntrophales bacterium]
MAEDTRQLWFLEQEFLLFIGGGRQKLVCPSSLYGKKQIRVVGK